MPARLALALVLILGLARSTAAQQPLQPGDTVKLLAPTLTANRYTPLTGVVSRIGPTDLFIVGAEAERAIPLAAIVELRKTWGYHRETWRGVGAGLLAGSVIGHIGGTGSDAGDENLAKIATLVGAAVGGIVGSRIKTTRWHTLPLSTVRPDPLPGTVVRIVSLRFSTAAPVRGTIRSWSADSVGFQREGDTAVLVLPASEVSSVEWPVSRRRQTMTGSLIGLGIGAVVGAIAAGVSAESCTSWCFFTPEESALIGGTGGGVLGAAIGAVAGSLTHRTTWERGQPGPPRIAVAPLISPHGWGLAVSLSF